MLWYESGSESPMTPIGGYSIDAPLPELTLSGHLRSLY